MKKMVGTTFFVIMLTMAILIGVAYLAATAYIDPALKELEKTVSGLQPEIRVRMTSCLAQLEQIRHMAALVIPAVFFMAGLTMTLVLSPLIRRFAKSIGAADKGLHKMEIRVSREQQRPSEAVSRPFVDAGACRIMTILQNKGRLIDFLEEDLAGYPDAQIGAAVRRIHEDSRNALREYVSLAPVLTEKEGAAVVISEGFDPAEIRLTGHVTGKAPFKGTVQHPGWKVTKMNLPEQPKGQKHTVIAPAEVEIE